MTVMSWKSFIFSSNLKCENKRIRIGTLEFTSGAVLLTITRILMPCLVLSAANVHPLYGAAAVMQKNWPQDNMFVS